MSRITLFAACLLILTQQALSQTSGPTLTAYCPWRTFLGTGNNAGCATTWSYKGIVYNNECTTRDHFRPWCSTVSGDYSILELWGNCDMNTNCEYYCGNFTTGGTMGGAPCKFPFTYNGVVYNSCTAVDHPRMWCTDQPVYTNRWGNCQYDTAVCSPTYCTDRTFLGTAFGAPCAVPFVYKGVVYNECTSVEHFRDWCSTTSTFSGAWGNCLDRNCPALCTGVTAGGTAGQAPCVFPFTYRGQTFEKCTGLDNNNVLWCSTTPIYTRFWGNCVYDRTELGTGNGVKCASSWTYKGVTYNNECTNIDHFRYWCSTKEGAFSLDSWGNCLSKDCTPFCRTQTSLGTAQGARCNFPFNYQGRSFGSCTNFDHNTLWCATTPEYEGMWGNCMYDSACSFPYCDDRTIQGTAFWAPCVIPFTYNGVEYDNCTTIDHNQAWCSTDAVYKGNWGNCMGQDCSNHCADRTAGGTDGGKACVLPFTYKGITFKSCTTFENFGRPWCSTTPVFNGLWGGCVYQKPCKNLCRERTVRGTGGNAPCVFPFTYKGVSYTSCTSIDNRDILWCSTTSVYQGGYGACVYEC